MNEEIVLFTDGASKGNPGPSGAGFLIQKEGQTIYENSIYLGIQTNNQAEYRALLEGLSYAKDQGMMSLLVCMDSELIVKQIKGQYRVKNEKLKPLYENVKSLMIFFDKIDFLHIRRKLNTEADRLANEALRLHKTF